MLAVLVSNIGGNVVFDRVPNIQLQLIYRVSIRVSIFRRRPEATQGTIYRMYYYNTGYTVPCTPNAVSVVQESGNGINK